MRMARHLDEALALALTLAAAAGCGAGGQTEQQQGPSTGTGGSIGGGGSGGNAGGTIPDAGVSDSAIVVDAPSNVDAESCAADSYEGQLVMLDMYLMLDRSGSMNSTPTDAGGPTYWDQVTQAIDDFLSLQGTTGISMGIGFFPTEPSVPPPRQCQTGQDCLPYGDMCMPMMGCADTIMEDESCWHFDYEKPVVPISELPAAATKLSNAIGSVSPSGGTPMAPALYGAAAYAQSWAKQHPDHATFVVLATDGMPTSCVPDDVPKIAEIAAGAYEASPSVKTFVIGIGTKLTALNNIAEQGGTDEALIVDETGNTGEQFLEKLNAIRGTVSCVYRIPSPDAGKPDKNKVNVYFTPDGGEQTLYPYASSKAQCGNEKAWYYDNPNDPHQIILCPAACEEVQTVKGRIDVVIGCETEPIK